MERFSGHEGIFAEASQHAFPAGPGLPSIGTTSHNRDHLK